MPKIAVIANCQARPVAKLCGLLVPGSIITGIGIVQLLKANDEVSITSACETADVIFAQLVHDTFPVSFVRSDVLRQRYPGKVIVWPNLFYRGQCPDLFYATGPAHERLMGPMQAYHLRSVLEAWRAGVTAKGALASLADTPPDAEDISAVSLNALRARERSTDIAASDLIEEEWREFRLFFTFNHPRARLLEAVSRRLFRAAGLNAEPSSPVSFGEPLGRIIPPMSVAMAHRLGFRFPEMAEAIRGLVYPLQAGKARDYSLDELVETSYQAYDDQPELARNAKLS